MALQNFVSGYALFDSSYYCGLVSKELSSYLGNGAKQKITELIFPADLPEFLNVAEAVVKNGMTERTAIVRVLTDEGNYRRCRINISLHKGNTFKMEIIDIISSVDNCIESKNTAQRISFLLEKQRTVVFEFDYRRQSLEIYRYDNSEKISLRSNPIYAFIYENLLRNITNPASGSICFVFDNTYSYNGTKYRALGYDLVRNAEKEKMIGTITTVDDEKSTSDETNIVDAMTGLYNKPYSLSLARESLNTKQKVSIVMMDIDDFKSINDTYGHMFGDEVIKKLALILKDVVTNKGFAGRFGGDEFFLCLYDIESEQELRATLQSIYYHFKQSFPDKNHVFTLTMGVAEYPRNGSNFDVLIKKADRALYIGKFKGKNRYIIYKEHIHGELTEDDLDSKSIVREESSNRQSQLRVIKNAVIQLSKALKSNADAKTVLDNIFSEMIGIYKFEGVNAYAGEGYKNIYRFGKLATPMEDASYINVPGVLEQFNDMGIFHTAVKYVRDKYIDEFHGNLAKHGLMTSLQILVGTKDDVKAVFTFDTENDLGSCSVEEMQDILLLVQMAAELLL